MTRIAIALFTGVLLLGCRDEPTTGDPDFVAHSLILSSPAPADWLPVGSHDAWGSAEHVTDVTLDGEPVLMVAEDFTLTVELERGMNVLELRGNDMRADSRYVRNGILVGDFKSPTADVDDAAVMRINKTGLNLIFGLVGGFIDTTLINTALVAANPVFDGDVTVPVAGGTSNIGHMKVDIVAVRFTEITVEGTPSEDELDMVITIEGLEIDMTIIGDVVGIPTSVELNAWADRAVAVGTLGVGVNNKELAITFENPATNFVEFGFDTNVIPGDFETQFSGLIEAEITTRIDDILAVQVPRLVRDITAGLDLSFETELLGKTVVAEAKFADAAIDPDGLQMVMDMDVSVDGNKGYYYPGFLTADGLGDPSVDRTQDMAVGIYDDMLNKVLFETWKAGMLEQSLSTTDGSLPVATLGLLGGKDEGTINVMAALPPIVMDKGGQLEIQSAEIMVEILTPGGDLGDRTLMAVSATIPITPVITNGKLTLSTGVPDVGLVVREGESAATNESLTQVLDENIPIALLVTVLRGIEFPIPTLAGISVQNAVVARDAGGAFTNITLDLN